ncbi:MAG: hypothetical protein WAO52_19730 [Prolixibacteraceae bacterium]
MLRQLGISRLRPGANNNDPNAENAANYDEAKANPFPNLPDPLILKNGNGVSSPTQWWNERHPEIIEDFDHEIYDRVPENTPKVTWEINETKNDTIGKFKVITKKLIGRVDNSSSATISVDIQLSLTTLATASSPVPAIINFVLIF